MGTPASRSNPYCSIETLNHHDSFRRGVVGWVGKPILLLVMNAAGSPAPAARASLVHAEGARCGLVQSSNAVAAQCDSSWWSDTNDAPSLAKGPIGPFPSWPCLASPRSAAAVRAV